MPALVNPSSDTLPSISDDADAVKLLFATNDSHGGVIVDMKTPMDPEAFVSSLRASIRHWRKEGKKGIWIKLPIELVNLVQIAVKEGFWYHHAETAYLMLVYWIPDTVHTLPVNASHRVGVGAFVMNDKGEVLVVQEKGGKLQGKGVWKFPTGVINEGEDIYAGVVREVKEETGIDAEFVEVLAFRQSHKSFFEKSDLFFICRLRPLSSDIQKQESEIEASQWMPLEEYAAQTFVQKHELFKYIADICLAKIGKGYTGFSPVCTKSSLSDKQSHLYLNSKDLKQHLSSALFLSVSNNISTETVGKTSINSSLCQYPCISYSPPGTPSYGTLPPPPPSVQGNCPPSAGGIQCCQYPPKTPYANLPYYSTASSLHFSTTTLAIFHTLFSVVSFYFCVLFWIWAS